MKIEQRFVAFLLAIAMVLPLFVFEDAPLTLTANAVWDGTPATSFSSGSGTSTSPYLIKTPAQMGYFLKQLSDGVTFSGKYFKLGANVDMTGGSWIPVDTEFSGDFNGNGYTLTVDTQFVKTIGETGRVRFLRIVRSAENSGAIVCTTNKGTIEGCLVNGIVKESTYAGGMVYQNDGVIMNSAFVGEVGGPNCDAGGLVYKNTGTINNVYCSAVMSAYGSGKYGSATEDALVISDSGTFHNVYYNSANGSSKAGIAVAEADMKAQSFVTRLNADNPSLVTKWSVDTANANGGFPTLAADNKLDVQCGLSYTTEDIAIYSERSLNLTITTTGTTSYTVYFTLDGTDPVTSSTRKTGRTGYTFTVMGDKTIKMVAYSNGVYGVVRTQKLAYMAGSGTEEAPYQIATKMNLCAIEIAPDAHFELVADLSFTDSDFSTTGILPRGWQPIESFSGVLEGNGHSISNLQGDSGGFVKTNSGTISGIRFINHQLTGSSSTFGSIVKTNNSTGTITRCYVDLNVTTVRNGNIHVYVGGICGSNSGTISYCQITGQLNVLGPSYRYCWIDVGAIAGGPGYVRSCYSDLHVDITSRETTEYVQFGGIAVGGYVYDCRNDGTVHFDVALDYDIYANRFSTRYAEYCVGDLNYTKSLTYGSNFRLSSYHQSYEKLYYSATGPVNEEAYPELDFAEKWMVLANGPVPQGIMNADGTYYTKTGYQQPGCVDGFTLYTDNNGKTYSCALPANGIHLGGTASCTQQAVCELCNAAYGEVDTSNHTGLQAAELTNCTSFPFTYADGVYTSTNKGGPTQAKFTVKACMDMTLGIAYTVSSEENYDKLLIVKNEYTTLGNFSGQKTGTLEVSLAKGDVLTLSYYKDSSVSKYEDKASFSLTIPQMQVTCTQDLVCNDCNAVVEKAPGHSFLTGVNSTTYPFEYNNGTYTSTNHAHSSNASYTFTADAPMSLTVEYTTSSESYDRFIVVQNGNTVISIGGANSGKKSVTLNKGDKLVLKYVKDGSISSGSDCVSFKLTSIQLDPGCTEVIVCNVCNDQLPLRGHDYVDHVLQNPTCTDIGWYAYQTCSRCTYTSYVERPATGHNYTESVQRPTCIQEGLRTYTCAACGHSYTEVIQATGHAHEAVVTAPTCTEGGYTTYTCTNLDPVTQEPCANSYVDNHTEALGHSGDMWMELVAPTCTEPGIKARICTVCMDTESVAVDPLGHSFDSVVTAPTCTQKGYTTNTCTACGEVTTTDIVEKVPHSFDSVVTAPTCTQEGYTTNTCTVCGEVTTTDIVETVPHSYDSVVTAPSCTQEGYTTNSCTVCGEVTTTDIVETVPHSYDSVVTAPSCTQEGCTTNTCTVCGEVTTTDIVDALGHSNTSVVTAPTCTQQGYTTNTCTVCAEVTITDYVDAKGHTWSAWVQIKAATCTQEGSQMRFCNCGVKETAAVEKAAHTYENGVCTVCGALESYYWVLNADIQADLSLNEDLYVDLNGHDLTGVIAANGYKVYGMDSSTNEYSCGTIGYFSCVDENGEAVVPERHFKTTEELSGEIRRYMTIEAEEGYTFHRFYLGIISSSLNTVTTGVGYKAVFYGDDMVKSQLDAEKAYGYTLQLGEFNAVSHYKDADSFQSGDTVTLRINNFDVANYGETELNAYVCMQLNDGTVICSADHRVTLREMVESVNANYTLYSEEERKALKTMIREYPVMQAWNVGNLYNSEDGVIDIPIEGNPDGNPWNT